jgi:hypothetical protein
MQSYMRTILIISFFAESDQMGAGKSHKKSAVVDMAQPWLVAGVSLSIRVIGYSQCGKCAGKTKWHACRKFLKLL